MIFVNLCLVPVVLVLLVLFVTTTTIVQGGKSTFISLANLASLHSTKMNAESFEGLGLE